MNTFGRYSGRKLKAPSLVPHLPRVGANARPALQSHTHHRSGTVVVCHAFSDDAGAATVRIPVEEIQPGQEMDGVVKTVAPYGCFVDVGATSDGLVHISQLSDEFVRDIHDFVWSGQEVRVKVLGVDGPKRLSLTMRSGQPTQQGQQRRRRARDDAPVAHGFEIGDSVTGEVVRIQSFGAFLEVPLSDGSKFDVLLPISQMATDGTIPDPRPNNLVNIGDVMECTVIKSDGNKVAVTNISQEGEMDMW